MKLLLRLRVEALHLLIQGDESLGHQLDLRLHVLRHDVEVPARFGGPGLDKNLQALTLIRDERLQARAMVSKGRVNMLANSCLDGVNMPARIRGAGLDLPAQIDRGCVNILPRLGGAGLDLLAQLLANFSGARLDFLAQVSAHFRATGLYVSTQFFPELTERRLARVPVHGS